MANKKLKLLYLARYLREETDERPQDRSGYDRLFGTPGYFRRAQKHL